MNTGSDTSKSPEPETITKNSACQENESDTKYKNAFDTHCTCQCLLNPHILRNTNENISSFFKDNNITYNNQYINLNELFNLNEDVLLNNEKYFCDNLQNFNTDDLEAEELNNEYENSTEYGSFYLHRQDESELNSNYREIIKYINSIGFVNKPNNVVEEQYVGLPKSSSMEVNTSSLDTEIESDTVSLVDSLDDPYSPRQSTAPLRNKHDEKLVRGDLFLPDNSASHRESLDEKYQKKSSVFFVPVTKSDVCNNIKTISEYLPDKLRDKLNKRQQQIEKKKHSRQDSSCNEEEYRCIVSKQNSLYDSSNHKSFINLDSAYDILHYSKNGILKRNEFPNDGRPANKSFSNRNIIYVSAPAKLHKRKPNKTENNSYAGNQSCYFERSKTSNKYLNDNIKKINDKFRTNPTKKHSEILKIVRPNVTKSTNGSQCCKKSRIPVLIHHNGSELPLQQMHLHTGHSPFNFMEMYKEDPKINQLIANILIDALNKMDAQMTVDTEQIETPLTTSKKSAISVRYKKRDCTQNFDIISEEKLSTLPNKTQSETNNAVKDESQNEMIENNLVEHGTLEASSQTETNSLSQFYKEMNVQISEAVFSVMKNEDVIVSPNGCIIVCMLQKNSDTLNVDEGQGNMPKKVGKSDNPNQTGTKHISKDSSSSQDMNSDNQMLNKLSENKLVNNADLDSNVSKSPNFMIAKKEVFDSSSESCSQSLSVEQEYDQSSSGFTLPITHLPIRQNKRQSHRKIRESNGDNQANNTVSKPGGWSVTVSGTNSCGNRAPDLEMRIKFPRQRANSQTDSEAKKECQQTNNDGQDNLNDQEFYLPPAKTSGRRSKIGYKEKIRNDSFKFLPNLMNSKIQRNNNCNKISSKQDQNLLLMPPLKTATSIMRDYRPRQTITSHRRFSLNHRNHLQPHLDTVFSSSTNINLRSRMELPECFTDVLAINGTVISPKKLRKCL